MKYYKIVDTENGHRGLFYKEGFNEDPLPFNPKGDCEPGGIYFAKEDILVFLSYGNAVYEVEPVGEIYENPGSPKKWKAHAVNLKYIGEWKNPETMKLLLDAGADVHACNDYALRLAAHKGYAEIVKLLLDAGADIHASDDEALRAAADNSHTEIVKLLLDAGADVHACNDYALRLAAYNGHAEIVKLLLNAGAYIHAYDDEALRRAADNGHTEIVKLLEGYYLTKH